MKRLAILAAAATTMTMTSCHKESAWKCRPLGSARQCAEVAPVPTPGSAWRCYEWRAWLVCSAAATEPQPPAPWRCRPDGRRTYCARGDLRFPDSTTGAATTGAIAWRCARAADGSRRCRPRAWGNDAWTCNDDGCDRRYPNFPNQWEWDCAETNGRVACVSDTPAATDGDWTCGKLGERLLCVDPDPDLPDFATSWACRHQYGGKHWRACRHTGEPRCTTDDACPSGLCLDGRCILGPLAADCYLPADCPGGSCAGGTCLRP